MRCEYNLEHHWQLWRAYLSTRREIARAVYPPPVTAVWCPSVTLTISPSTIVPESDLERRKWALSLSDWLLEMFIFNKRKIETWLCILPRSRYKRFCPWLSDMPVRLNTFRISTASANHLLFCLQDHFIKVYIKTDKLRTSIALKLVPVGTKIHEPFLEGSREEILRTQLY